MKCHGTAFRTQELLLFSSIGPKYEWFTVVDKGQKISKEKCCPGFFRKTNAGAILCRPDFMY